MNKIVFLILFSVFIISCSKKTQNTIDDLYDNFSFNSTLSNTTQIIIKQYDSTTTNKTIDVEKYLPNKEFKTTKEQVKDFEIIFENAEKTGYCCCPKSSYTVHFFNGSQELDIFYVDTLELKDKVRIFETSYQYSYIVEKQKWKNFLNKISKK